MEVKSKNVSAKVLAKVKEKGPLRAKRTRKSAHQKLSSSTKAKRKPVLDPEEEAILKKGAIYCLLNFPTLWTVGGIKEEKGEDDSRQWIIAVYLRYPTGFEGYLGDLLYDGQRITELTSREVMRGRSRQIAADPKGRQEWNDYRNSALSTGKT